MKPLFIERNIVGKIVWLLIKMAFIVLVSLLFALFVHTFMLSAFGETSFYTKIIDAFRKLI